ncbi:periplasmic substrate-binding component of an ABC superfamily glucosamine transporter [Rahnella aquatilis CIP 78.65 = ATCC 33071]|uniref:ABC-type sugar transport system, periplasmic component n=1 Tax=Rahnella aquatilis (strain ATCC 33071 / DSM 4594 / JCM 1683 / NBRC 105701 / NCIMB 13365 / CIP 78.65) TaxID=745277 RepID=H2IZX9_RAHAC|nr:extracellular solute-binding protein [Rahnella aquatilis]AEX52161.1 ABC-type sugar transport system, periplasmic component [Rahnella aquatilis CIP 78.65 = ATCC 33071]KFD11287.1 periplasmic substrate-binding component of an ABC superfamily glucosamine transporter [Rahnella aquatilis CIP 78.65 = ATCC 33071]
MSLRFTPAATLCALSALTLGYSASALADTTISALFMTQAAYSEADIRAMTADFTKQHPDIKVNLEFVPYEALHDKIVAARGAGDKGYDVVLFDAIWPAEFNKYGLLQDVTARIPAEESNKIFDGAISTVTYKDKRWGMPWILDTKYLYYNKAMLAKAGITTPPATWADVEKQSEILKAKGIVKYPLVWSWSQSEALLCDYTTLVSAFKGDFYKDGKLNFTNSGAMKAISYMKETLDKGLTNPNSREYLEEDVRKSFSNGDAAFALNWTYMYNMANDPKQSKVAGDVGVIPAPGETAGGASGVNGSMGLGIAKASAHADQAWEYISYMTSQPVQNKYAKLSLPIWKSSYEDPAVQKDQEQLIAAAKTSLNVMLSRPVTADYSRLSNILQQNIQAVLQGKTPAQDGMEAATQAADRLR